jgi:hypothetical protein
MTYGCVFHRSIAMFSDIDQAHISGGNFTLIGKTIIEFIPDN